MLVGGGPRCPFDEAWLAFDAKKPLPLLPDEAKPPFEAMLPFREGDGGVAFELFREGGEVGPDLQSPGA